METSEHRSPPNEKKKKKNLHNQLFILVVEVTICNRPAVSELRGTMDRYVSPSHSAPEVS